jgi:hypothetical protein
MVVLTYQFKKEFMQAVTGHVQLTQLKLQIGLRLHALVVEVLEDLEAHGVTQDQVEAEQDNT